MAYDLLEDGVFSGRFDTIEEAEARWMILDVYDYGEVDKTIVVKATIIDTDTGEVVKPLSQIFHPPEVEWKVVKESEAWGDGGGVKWTEIRTDGSLFAKLYGSTWYQNPEDGSVIGKGWKVVEISHQMMDL
jgi:hypothetical protein